MLTLRRARMVAIHVIPSIKGVAYPIAKNNNNNKLQQYTFRYQ
jgi:hypothetical protein